MMIDFTLKGNQYALHAISEGRAELGGETLESRFRHLRESLFHVGATLRLFDTDADLSTIAGYKRVKLFGAGKLNQMILAVLRRSARSRPRLAESDTELAERASRFLKAELKRAGTTDDQLAETLKEHGLAGETDNSIKAKMKRGTFAATFFLACLAAMDLEGITPADI